MKILACLLLVFSLSGCVSSGEDYQIAEKVGDYLDAADVIPDDTREANAGRAGRIVYVGPGRNGNPHFTYYEVTPPQDIARVESAARLAVDRVPGAKSVTLHFVERQVFHGGVRGHENEVRRIVVRKRAAP